MSTVENTALVRRLVEAYNQADFAALRGLLAADYVCHVGGQPEPLTGLEANLASEAAFRAAFSNVRWTIEDLLAAGDKVLLRRAWQATHTGPFLGVPATGRTLSGTAMDLYEIRAGQLAAQWTESDNLSFLQQLGALPAPEH